MAQFSPAYQIIRANEGGYLNDSADTGGRTYMGVAESFHPTWPGFRVLNDFQAQSGIELDRGAFLPLSYQRRIEPLHQHFFNNMWLHSRAGEINDQALANIYFDFYILHSKAVKALQEALNILGANVVVDNAIGPQTINAINATNPSDLHDIYKLVRLQYHAKRKSSKFYDGWIARTDTFPNLSQNQHIRRLVSNQSNQLKAGNTKLWWIIGLSLASIGFYLQSEHYQNMINAGDYER